MQDPASFEEDQILPLLQRPAALKFLWGALCGRGSGFKSSEVIILTTSKASEKLGLFCSGTLVPRVLLAYSCYRVSPSLAGGAEVIVREGGVWTVALVPPSLLFLLSLNGRDSCPDVKDLPILPPHSWKDSGIMLARFMILNSKIMLEPQPFAHSLQGTHLSSNGQAKVLASFEVLVAAFRPK